MRANEFLREFNVLGIDGTGVKEPETVTITIPKHLLNIEAEAKPEEEGFDPEIDRDPGAEEEQETASAEENDMDFEQDSGQEDELAHIVRLSKGEHRTPPAGQNHTIAAPATDEVLDDPVFISPLQQQLELQKQQGGKESPFINQIIDKTTLGSTASEQPEQSVYHDSPLKDNEFVGAGTGAIDKLRNATTTQGANKPWYKL